MVKLPGVLDSLLRILFPHIVILCYMLSVLFNSHLVVHLFVIIISSSLVNFSSEQSMSLSFLDLLVHFFFLMIKFPESVLHNLFL